MSKKLITRRALMGGLTGVGAAFGLSAIQPCGTPAAAASASTDGMGMALRGTDAPAAVAATGEIGIAFLGDSMVDGLWGGMLRLSFKEACLEHRIKCLRFGENGSGLTRPARFDWIEQTRTIVETQKPTLAIISLGLNDRQSIVDLSSARFDLGTAGWRTRYGELVASMAKVAAASTAGVLWLGLPALRDKVSQDDASIKNEIFAEALNGLKDPRIQYLDAWRQDAGQADEFAVYGPDVNGARVQIRTSDGIHFTPAGYDVLARYVFSKVADHLRAQHIMLDYPCDA